MPLRPAARRAKRRVVNLHARINLDKNGLACLILYKTGARYDLEQRRKRIVIIGGEVLRVYGADRKAVNKTGKIRHIGDIYDKIHPC
jgi:hypothetical protein